MRLPLTYLPQEKIIMFNNNSRLTLIKMMRNAIQANQVTIKDTAKGAFQENELKTKIQFQMSAISFENANECEAYRKKHGDKIRKDIIKQTVKVILHILENISDIQKHLKKMEIKADIMEKITNYCNIGAKENSIEATKAQFLHEDDSIAIIANVVKASYPIQKTHDMVKDISDICFDNIHKSGLANIFPVSISDVQNLNKLVNSTIDEIKLEEQQEIQMYGSRQNKINIAII